MTGLLVNRFDELRDAGSDTRQAVRILSSETGLDQATVKRQLKRSLRDADRDPEAELRHTSPPRRTRSRIVATVTTPGQGD